MLFLMYRVKKCVIFLLPLCICTAVILCVTLRKPPVIEELLPAGGKQYINKTIITALLYQLPENVNLT